MFYAFIIFSHIPIFCKTIELFAKCPSEFKALYGLQRLRLKNRTMYKMQGTLLRGTVLFFEILGILGTMLDYFFPNHSVPWPLTCHFFGSLIHLAVAEVLVSILSLQVKNPKLNLRIDAIFLIILTAVLYLGEFSFPCLFISSFIIIIFEAMHIRDVFYGKVVMWSEKRAQKLKQMHTQIQNIKRRTPPSVVVPFLHSSVHSTYYLLSIDKMSLDEPPFVDKAILKLFGFTLIALSYSLSTFYALLQFRKSELYENCFIRTILYTFVIFSLIPIGCKAIELFAKCPPELKSRHGFQRLRDKDSSIFKMYVIILRGSVVYIEIGGILGTTLDYFFPNLSKPCPLACGFFFSLLQPAVAEMMVSILSLQVKEFKPKPNLRIDFIFLIILTAVLYLGEFSFPCLIICFFIIIVFEAMHIRDVFNAKIIMWSKKKGQKNISVLPGIQRDVSNSKIYSIGM
uniref:Transmembrane epididymal protein 1-like n=1 Tax=Caenorhabditis tropicalis TaxID=1561998 RepID=A0A1I7UYQ0_9PELO